MPKTMVGCEGKRENSTNPCVSHDYDSKVAIFRKGKNSSNQKKMQKYELGGKNLKIRMNT